MGPAPLWERIKRVRLRDISETIAELGMSLLVLAMVGLIGFVVWQLIFGGPD